MTQTILRLISSLIPPKAPNSEPGLTKPELRTRQLPQLENNITQTRRDIALLSVLTIASNLSSQTPALAFEFGISGPKNWLKEQKKKSAKFLLAPIYASRESLQAAYSLLSDEGKSGYSSEDVEEVQKLLRSAARDCVVQERNSLVVFQANTGVEVCTFRLLVKNAASLLEDKNPVKLEAEAKLNDLIRSFTSLSDTAKEVNIQAASSRQKVADALMDTMSSLDKFEQGIVNCLEI